MHYKPNKHIHVAAYAITYEISTVIDHTFSNNIMKAVYRISRSLVQAKRQIDKEGLKFYYLVSYKMVTKATSKANIIHDGILKSNHG